MLKMRSGNVNHHTWNWSDDWVILDEDFELLDFLVVITRQCLSEPQVDAGQRHPRDASWFREPRRGHWYGG